MLFLPTNIDALTRRERERYFKRMEILNAAVVLFAENGYSNTTIETIAEKSEFGKGTIYNYFDGKENIYWEIINEIFDAYLEALNEIDRTHQSFIDFIMNITKELFAFCTTHKHAFVMITRLRTGIGIDSVNVKNSISDYQAKVDSIFLKRIEAAVESGEIKTVDPNSLLALYRSMIFPYIYNKMFCDLEKGNEKIDISEETELIVNILFNGIKK